MASSFAESTAAVGPPPGYVRQRHAGVDVLARCDDRDWLVPLLATAVTDFAGHAPVPLAGGRGATVRIDLATRSLAIRGGRRGGLPGRIWRSLYFGLRPRVYDEIGIDERLAAAGVPVARALGAAVAWLAPGCYRSWIAHEFVPDCCTLWDWLGEVGTSPQRVARLRDVGAAVRGMHRAGVWHPDLNLGNVLVRHRGGGGVVLIDFDRAVLGAAKRGGIDAVLRRMQRSAARWGGTAARLAAGDCDALRAGYGDGDG